MLDEISMNALKQIAHRDPEALGRFYDRWEAPVHAFVARLIGDAEAQERVMDEIFWTVWERAGSRDSTPVEAWVHTLAVACCQAELKTIRGDVPRLPVRLRASA
jgi:DNA-directed RNA polymerase specialized sigma24 family protein